MEDAYCLKIIYTPVYTYIHQYIETDRQIPMSILGISRPVSNKNILVDFYEM